MNILWCRLHTYPGHSTPSLQLYIFFWITQHNHEPTIYFLIAANHTTDRKQIFTPTGVGIGAAFRIEPLCCLSVCPLFGFFSLTPLCCMRPPWSSFGSVICFCRYNWYSFFFLNDQEMFCCTCAARDSTTLSRLVELDSQRWTKGQRVREGDVCVWMRMLNVEKDKAKGYVDDVLLLVKVSFYNPCGRSVWMDSGVEGVNKPVWAGIDY